VTNAATIQSQIIALISDWSGRRKPITPDTAVYHDLVLSGDDAVEILTAVSKQYAVSFDGFNFSSYSPGEPFLGSFLWSKSKDKYKRLTVAHLVAVAERGAWFEP